LKGPSEIERSSDVPNIRECLDRLRRNLKAVESVRRRPAPGTENKFAAVLLPLFERDGDLHLLYTRRSDRLASHRGQVAFPGGRLERRDQNLAAALREAHEEIGLDPQRVEMLGTFPGRTTRSTNIPVTPFVGMIRGPLDLRPDPKEVAEIFHVPLTALRDPRYRGHHNWRINGYVSKRDAILYEGQVIWGLTYELTMTLLELLDGVRR
jgi:8-oxo-dGTP pyrophosphatase MutT (NUDIX family)